MRKFDSPKRSLKSLDVGQGIVKLYKESLMRVKIESVVIIIDNRGEEK